MGPSSVRTRGWRCAAAGSLRASRSATTRTAASASARARRRPLHLMLKTTTEANAMADDGLPVTNNEAAHQFEVRVDGVLARLVYELAGERIILIHTDVSDALAGRGIGSAL